MNSAFKPTSQQIKLAILTRLKDRPNGDDKYNIIGRADAPAGAIESGLGGRFSVEQRLLASKCFDELRSADFIRSTHGGNSRPEDWVVITDEGRAALSSGLIEPTEKDGVVQGESSSRASTSKSEMSEQSSPVLLKHGVDVAAKYIFLDIVGFTHNRSTEAQAEIVKQLNEIVSEALEHKSISSDQRIFLPTGDGICIALLTIENPFDIHIQIALSILNRLNTYNASTQSETRRFHVRIGIDANTDTLVADINNQQNIAGAGISMASRIMNLADGNQILVGQAVYDILRHREKYTSAFKAFQATVKHDTQISVFQFISADHEWLNTSPPTRCQSNEESQTRISNVDFFNRAQRAGAIHPIAEELLEYIKEMRATVDISVHERRPEIDLLQGEINGLYRLSNNDIGTQMILKDAQAELWKVEGFNPTQTAGADAEVSGALTSRWAAPHLGLTKIHVEILFWICLYSEHSTAEKIAGELRTDVKSILAATDVLIEKGVAVVDRSSEPPIYRVTAVGVDVVRSSLSVK